MRSENSAVRPHGHASPSARRQVSVERRRCDAEDPDRQIRSVTKVAHRSVRGRKKRRQRGGSGGGGGVGSRSSGPSTFGPGVMPGGVTLRAGGGDDFEPSAAADATAKPRQAAAGDRILRRDDAA